VNSVEQLSRSEMASLLRDVIESERSMTWDDFRSHGGKQHTRAQCRASRKAGAPKNCVVHNPSNHKGRGWPMVLRSSGLIERRCPHGVGHPDPDSAAYLDWASKGHGAYTVHGCDIQDGRPCCSQPEVSAHKILVGGGDYCLVCGSPIHFVQVAFNQEHDDGEWEGFWRHNPRTK
jgi:hypothetical protein